MGPTSEGWLTPTCARLGFAFMVLLKDAPSELGLHVWSLDINLKCICDMGRSPLFLFIDTNLGLACPVPIVPGGAVQISFVRGNPLEGEEEGLPRPLPLVLFPYRWPRVPAVITVAVAVRETVAHLPSKWEHKATPAPEVPFKCLLFRTQATQEQIKTGFGRAFTKGTSADVPGLRGGPVNAQWGQRSWAGL